VTFVAADAQFTPKQVETARERENLMFRVKVQIGQDLLERYARLVKTGLPGVAYVRTDSAAAWPEWLAARLPDAG
jgi:HlyD family secretion protein